MNTSMNTSVNIKRTGIDFFTTNSYYLDTYKGKRLAMITNQTGLDVHYKLSHCLVNKRYTLVKLFSPEHGLFGNCGAGEDVSYYTDTFTGLPVFSLYSSKSQAIDDSLLEDVDAIVYDIQDVGVRCYTYISTLFEAMKTCQRTKTVLVVLDRPPMLGRCFDGPVMEKDFESFVGIYNIPFRYGLTPGEFAKLVYSELGYDFPLEIVCFEKDTEKEFANERAEETIEENPESFNYVFVPPSVSIPTFDSALAYSAMALLEGTNISEGRGTSTPFQVFGAPFITAKDFVERLNSLNLAGVAFTPVAFTPSFSKHSGLQCQGCRMIFTNKKEFKSFETIMKILDSLKDMYPNDFELLEEGKKLSRLLGVEVHKDMMFSSLVEKSNLQKVAFAKRVKNFLMY